MGQRQRIGGFLVFLGAGWLVLVIAMVLTDRATGANVPNRWLVPVGVLAILIGGALLTYTREVVAFWIAGGGDEERVRQRTGMAGADIVRVVGVGWLGMGIVVLLLGVFLPPVTG